MVALRARITSQRRRSAAEEMEDALNSGTTFPLLCYMSEILAAAFLMISGMNLYW